MICCTGLLGGWVQMKFNDNSEHSMNVWQSSYGSSSSQLLESTGEGDEGQRSKSQKRCISLPPGIEPGSRAKSEVDKLIY